jgi:hypothetical protein
MKLLTIITFLLLLAASPLLAGSGKIKVFILAGQSNMQGQGVVSANHEKHYNGGKGNLVWSMEHSQSKGIMKHLKDKKGKWTVRKDVDISHKSKSTVRKGPLTVGFTSYGGSSHVGLELQFGHIVGDHFKEKVLLIKTAWGGKSLYADFRPPSSGGQVGPYYTKMIEEVHEALKQLKNEKYEIVGFVWMQGWNDMCSPPAIPKYADHLVNLVKDVRKEFKLPRLPVIIGELGNGGPNAKGSMLALRQAQKAGSAKIKNALFVETSSCARPSKLSPNTSHGHHWFGNAESYFLIGDKLGKGMLKLLNQ